MILLIAFYSLLALEQTEVKNFLKEASKNGEYKYAFVTPVKCLTGKLKNTYALAQNGRVFLKKLSKDGSVGPICIK